MGTRSCLDLMPSARAEAQGTISIYCNICTKQIKREVDYRAIHFKYQRGIKNTINYGTCDMCSNEILRFIANRALEARK